MHDALSLMPDTEQDDGEAQAVRTRVLLMGQSWSEQDGSTEKLFWQQTHLSLVFCLHCMGPCSYQGIDGSSELRGTSALLEILCFILGKTETSQGDRSIEERLNESH